MMCPLLSTLMASKITPYAQILIKTHKIYNNVLLYTTCEFIA